jgi:hypothetical protein
MELFERGDEGVKPEPFTGANNLLKAPENWDEKMYGVCPDLPVAQGNGMTLSCWRPSMEEIALLVGGGLVLLTVVGELQPAVQLDVVHTKDAEMGMARA